MSNYTYNVDYDYGTINFGNIATSGSILTTGGFNGTSWSSSSSPYVFSTSTTPLTVGGNGKIECTGEGADVVLNGKSIKATIEAIEDRLAILRPNPELEKEWSELKDLGQRYRTLEAEIKEKMRVWDILKKTDE